jgi:hypothetical protein
MEDQGLCPQYTIGDGGKGLRKGQEDAWPAIPCHGDVFHAIKATTDLRSYLENRAYGKINSLYVLERKMERAKAKQQGNVFSKQLALARAKAEQAITLHDDVNILAEWLRDDILGAVGPDLSTRRELLTFVLNELERREPFYAHRIKPVRTFLHNQAEDLLRFVPLISQGLVRISRKSEVRLEIVWEMYATLGLSSNEPQRWKREALLRESLGHRFRPVQQLVQELIYEIIRASSVVENLNSRLRSYFFLRKQLGPEYLELLQFFLNHRRFVRSRREERVGKSPAELLTGIEHKHWLVLLGFEKPQHAA